MSVIRIRNLLKLLVIGQSCVSAYCGAVCRYGRLVDNKQVTRVVSAVAELLVYCLHYSVKDLLSNVGDTFTKEEVSRRCHVILT